MNKIAVLLDKDEPCLARPFEKNTSWDGGHVIPISRYKQLRYNIWNIHKQGNFSNRSQKDDLLMLQGIERRYGKERREWMETLHLTYPDIKLFDKNKALTEARKIQREIESGKTLSRDEINVRVGI